jgi:hypothetical protein
VKNRSVLMHSRIRIIRHEVVPKSGSYEVRFRDGRESRFFYFDDVLARRLRPDLFTSEDALEQAKAFARAERDISKHSATGSSRTREAPATNDREGSLS